MAIAQGAGATDATEEPTPQPQPEPQPEPEKVESLKAKVEGPKAGQSLRGAVLAGMDLPEEVLKAVEVPAQVEQKPGEQEQPQEQEQEQEQEPEQEKPEPVAATAETPIPDEWPESAKARVAEEARKRRERTEELKAYKQATQEIQAAYQQLQTQSQQTAMAPTRQEPLSDVMDPGQLEQIVRVNEELEEWCDRNPDGADNVLVGRDTQGNEIRKDYTREDIVDMKSFAKRVQKRAPERRGYLQAMAVATREAAQLYPQMFEDGTEEAQVAAQILQQFPEVRRRPDFLLVVGDQVAGLKERAAKLAAKNGQRKGPGGRPLSPQAQAILGAPKVTPAPGVARRGGPDIGSGSRQGGSGSGEVEKARAEFEKSGFSEEGLEKFIAAKLANRTQGRGGKAPALA